uniref:Lipoprotein n=1 Tax=Sexangularia sp. CB-2014 TaxID=1486929 RepID=A0A7S1VME0_9EUKA|mmetsp:Transcript_5156/g.16594  ORF Transcript_5156/g.16594 Transcript_5156/m.16594 type:complete len:279 (+) Transcript_5156:111-947(+)
MHQPTLRLFVLQFLLLLLTLSVSCATSELDVDTLGCKGEPDTGEPADEDGASAGDELLKKAVSGVLRSSGYPTPDDVEAAARLIRTEKSSSSIIDGVWRREGFASVDFVLSEQTLTGATADITVRKLQRYRQRLMQKTGGPSNAVMLATLQDIFEDAEAAVRTNGVEGSDDKEALLQFKGSTGEMMTLKMKLARRDAGGTRWDASFQLAFGSFVPVTDYIIRTETTYKKSLLSSKSSTNTVLVPIESGLTEGRVAELINLIMSTVTPGGKGTAQQISV